MFEKEAEERARKLEESQTLGVYDNDEDLARDIAWDEGKVAGYEEGFRDGAEFGYNKANEWHDLRKDPNDLPDIHCLNWVIALYDNGTLWCRAKREKCVDGIFWVNSYHYQIYNVIAWKEITLPKEIKEK